MRNRRANNAPAEVGNVIIESTWFRELAVEGPVQPITFRLPMAEHANKPILYRSIVKTFNNMDDFS